jgi:N-acetylneuraminic acid mutarotase
VLIDGGKVHVVGGAVTTGAGEVPLAYCEIYDPETGAWTPTGSMTTPRAGHQATALPDGTVLVTGGAGPVVAADGTVRTSPVDTAERYDPATGEWTIVARMPGGRGRHRAVLLPTGVVVVIGGAGTVPTAGYRSVATYDPRTNTWAGTGALAVGRWDFAAVALADGRILIAGGHARAGASAASGAATPTAHTEIFTP